MSKKRNVLTLKKRIILYKEVEEHLTNKDAIKFNGLAKAAEYFSHRVGFPLTDANLRSLKNEDLPIDDLLAEGFASRNGPLWDTIRKFERRLNKLENEVFGEN